MPSSFKLAAVLATILAAGAGGGAAQGQPAGAAPAAAPAGTNDPFPQPIVADRDVITAGLREFATFPDLDGAPARLMTLVHDGRSKRLIVSDMSGILYAVPDAGGAARPYLDLREPRWGVGVQAQGRERGIQSIALHPQFSERGKPGFGKFYTYLDVSNQAPAADFTTSAATSTHDTVLLEWTARTPGAAAFDGAAPRELIRLRQPFANHNGGAIAFNVTARAGAADYGLLYIGVGDGGSGGDPLRNGQNMASAFGKILRIDPLGKSGRGGKYGIPATNPFVSTAGALPEIYAYGVRNSQRFAWDPKGGAMFMSDIGQNIVEEVNRVTAGANLGWSVWEGSFRVTGIQSVSTDAPRSDRGVTYPIVEWDQRDPLMLPSGFTASGSVVVDRSPRVPQLNGRLLFGDMPGGEIFHVSADTLPQGGQDAIRRVLFRAGGSDRPRRLLDIIQDKNRSQGRPPAARVDVRFDNDETGRIFLLNKADGVLRLIER